MQQLSASGFCIQILRLAVAIPEAHYGWRPMDGIGTVRDVLVHVTETNLMLGNRLGTKPPAGLARTTVGAPMNTAASSSPTPV
jgi:hypothetical protein